jgi:hypothetical protein
MKLGEFTRKIFTAGSGISSKRIFGGIGWMACLFVLIYCTLQGMQAPDIYEVTIIVTASLLGIDSITNIWKGRSKYQYDDRDWSQEEYFDRPADRPGPGHAPGPTEPLESVRPVPGGKGPKVVVYAKDQKNGQESEDENEQADP